MPIYLPVLMAILVIGMFSFAWERRWKRRRSTAAADQEATTASDSTLQARLSQGIATLRASFPLRQHAPGLENQFRSWSEHALATDVPVRHWLSTLSEPAYAAFVEHLVEFSDEMGFQLADLVNGQMACVPGVTEHATQVIVHYCRATQQAALAQDDFDGYRLYAAYRQAPTSTASQQYVQQLYAQLVEQQLVAAPTLDLMTLPEQARLTQIQEAIRQAADQPDTFRTALHMVAAERRRTPADFTVTQIVQRAMTKVAKPKAEPTPAVRTTAQEAPNDTAEVSDKAVVVPL